MTVLKQNTTGRISLIEKLEQIEVLYRDITVCSKKIINNKHGFSLADLNYLGYILVKTGSEEHQSNDVEENYIESQEICARIVFCSTEADNEWSMFFNLSIHILLACMSS